MRRTLILAACVASAYTVQFLAAQDWSAVLPDRPRATVAETPETLAREELGRKLFFDPILSANGKVSCSTCHEPDHGWASRGLPRGLDGKPLARKAPTLFNRSTGRSFFWDGRADFLETQALQPIENPNEMGNTSVKPVLERLKASKYNRMFEREFDDGVTANNLAKTLAAFEKVLQYKNTLDLYLGGRQDFTDEQERGYRLFNGTANCYRCHPIKGGAPLTDESFHNTGVGGGDYGRAGITRKREDLGKFKTPTLRGCVKTKPYMHNASLKTLEEVIDFYNRGGNDSYDGDKDLLIYPLGLTPRDKNDLFQFLVTL